MPTVEISWCCCFCSLGCPCVSSNHKHIRDGREKEPRTSRHHKRPVLSPSSSPKKKKRRKGKKWFFPHLHTKRDDREKGKNRFFSLYLHRKKDDDEKNKKGKKPVRSPSPPRDKENKKKPKEEKQPTDKEEKNKEKKVDESDEKKENEEKPAKNEDKKKRSTGETSNKDDQDHHHLPKYDAFISFRGTDVRQNFVSHLFAHMNNERHILTFKDDVSLRRGDEVSPSLDEAIERSSSYVVILSPNYATSGWCLDELVKIMECARKYGRKMIPVFYDGVTPSHVRHQKKRYAAAFDKHERKLPDKEMEAKIKRWRAALTEAANISGFDSDVVKPERRLVEEVTKSILGAIRPNSSPITEGLVGIEPEIEAVEKLLEVDDAQHNRIIGFWGMPGIGKTTLAKAIFHKIDADKFEGRHYIQNFAGQLKRSTTVIDLQNELFDKLLGDENSHAIPFDLKLNRLSRLRAFVIVDDVTSLQTLEELLQGKFCDLFGPGSRMILTSTDQQVLKKVCQEVHKVPGLNKKKALKLFSLCAFKKDQPPAKYKEMCDKVVAYCEGNPLALKILGLMFYDRTMGFWDGTLEKLRRLPKKEIQDLLMISYDELSSDEQSAFLDVACFFNYEDYEFVMRVLDEDLITNLVDKSLAGINYSKCEIEMHALLEDLGKEIVHKEKMLGKRSRLWESKDVLKLLAQNMGSEATEGIFLNLTEKEEKIKTESDAFEKMWNLRLLSIELAPKSKVVFPNEGVIIESLPNELRYLRWDLFAATSLPSEYSPENLRVLRLKHSSIRHLWEGTNVDLRNLKELNLTGSKYLTEVPDLSTAEKLELVDLTSCAQLLQLHNSIISLPSLKTLILDSCKALNLNNLDEEDTQGTDIVAFPSLERVNLDATPIEKVPHLLLQAPKLTKIDCSGCPNLSKFPSIEALAGNLSIKHLILRNNKLLVNIPGMVLLLKSLQTLDLYGCENLQRFPEIVAVTVELLRLDLSYCSKISNIPNTISLLHNLERLYLSGTGIQEIPSSILSLKRLIALKFDECKKLVKIPSSFKELSRLKTLDLDGCDMLNNKEPELPKSVKKKTKK